MSHPVSKETSFINEEAVAKSREKPVYRSERPWGDLLYEEDELYNRRIASERPNRVRPLQHGRPVTQEQFNTQRTRPWRPPTSDRVSNRPAPYNPAPQREGNQLRNRFMQPSTSRTQVSVPIENFDVSESTPLLSEVGTHVSTFGAASNVGSTLAGLATAAGAAGLGAATVGLVNRIKEKGAVLPGTDYVGPGNPIYEGPAKDATDQTARDHDLIYTEIVKASIRQGWTKLKFDTYVQEADKLAATSFWKNYNDEGKWQAFFGALGLKVKEVIERKTGVIYPSFPGIYK